MIFGQVIVTLHQMLEEECSRGKAKEADGTRIGGSKNMTASFTVAI